MFKGTWKALISHTQTILRKFLRTKANNLGSIQNIRMDVVVEHTRNLDQMLTNIQVIKEPKLLLRSPC